MKLSTFLRSLLPKWKDKYIPMALALICSALAGGMISFFWTGNALIGIMGLIIWVLSTYIFVKLDNLPDDFKIKIY